MNESFLSKIKSGNYLHILLIYTVWWIIFLADILITWKKSPNEINLLWNLIPLVLLFLAGSIISYFAMDGKDIRLRVILLVILVVTGIDQGIKAVMADNLYTYIPLIGEWLYLAVYFNDKMAWLSERFNITIHIPLIVSYFLGITPSFIALRLLHYYQKNQFLLKLATILLSAGMLGYCIDITRYGGSYDYIYFYPVLIFDIKDMCVILAAMVCVQALFFNGNGKIFIKMCKEDPWAKQFFKQEYQFWRALVQKIRRRKP
jgi:lipoprotein signal peptidase